MANTTPNHEFQLFADEEDPWEHRSDFQKLDTEIEIRDTDANKTNYDPKQGAKYLATDTGTRYRGDGSSWVILPVAKTGNGAITDGDGTDRQMWVIPAGASDPAGANSQDLIFEREG